MDTSDLSFPSRIGQREIKRRALIDAAFGPGAASVAVNNAANVGQADARAFELPGSMKALEDAKQFFRVTRLKADAIVANEENRFARGNRCADFDSGDLARSGVLQRVVDEIDQDMAKEIRVSIHLGQFRDCPIHAPLSETALPLPHDLLH